MKFIKNILFDYYYKQANKALDKRDMDKYYIYQRKIYHEIWSEYLES